LADKVVVCAGIYSSKFFKEPKQFSLQTLPMETFVFSDQSDLPSCFMLIAHFDGQE